MPSERVLIVGAGVAGSISAFWLAKHDFQVVVIERSKPEQKLGQGIEIEEPALQVVKAMGIMEKLKEKRTIESGFDLVDQQSRSYGRFDIGGFSPTGDLELMRGDLTEVLYKAAHESPNVTYHFETTIQSLRQTPDGVIVDLENRANKTVRTEEFDFVIGADGARSRTRQLVMGSPEELDCLKPIGSSVAYFSIPKEERDWPYSRMCHFPDRRVLWLRPTGKDSKETSVYLIYVNSDASALNQANATGDRMKQKEAWAELFGGLGWEMSRVITQMMKAENFYSEELTQVKLKKWSQNRVVLVGDAAWAPTPFTGEGNQLAIIGAWVLAQEMARSRSPVAFENYEKRLRSHVEQSQNIPFGGYGPYILVPRTTWGIQLLRNGLFLLSWVVRLFLLIRLPNLVPNRVEHVFDLEMEEDKSKVEGT